MTENKQRRRSWGTLKRLRSGRYRAEYTGPDGLIYAAPNTFQAKMDAEYWLLSERRKIDREMWTPPGTPPPLRLEVAPYVEQVETSKVTTVYMYFDAADRLLYVGVTNRGQRRSHEHAKTGVWWHLAASCKLEHYETRTAALRRESEMIQTFRPPFNISQNISARHCARAD